MSFTLPPLPDQGLLADRCREVAAREGVQPDLVEKDFYLTRLLWTLGEQFGDQLLLKGGTLLSKVDLGFFRMSEDADLIIPVSPSSQKGMNARRIDVVRNALARGEASLGLAMRFPGGEPSDRGSHRRWDLDYPSEFGRQSLQLEVSLRPILKKQRHVRLDQLLDDPFVGDYRQARCWALHADEARAEKVRAAFTREAIRDFYDLDRLAASGVDLSSKAFLSLVSAKLQELGAPRFEEQGQPFGLTPERRRALLRSQAAELPAVLRSSAPPFDLEDMLAAFSRLWSSKLR